MNKWANNTIEELQMANKTPAKCIHFNMQLINMQFSMQTEVCPTVIFKKTNERELEELGELYSSLLEVQIFMGVNIEIKNIYIELGE